MPINQGKLMVIEVLKNSIWRILTRVSDIRIKKIIFCKIEHLEVPKNIVWSHKISSRCESVEELCSILNRLSYSCRFTDMVSLFLRNPTEICLIFNVVLNLFTSIIITDSQTSIMESKSSAASKLC